MYPSYIAFSLYVLSFLNDMMKFEFPPTKNQGIVDSGKYPRQVGMVSPGQAQQLIVRFHRYLGEERVLLGIPFRLPIGH